MHFRPVIVQSIDPESAHAWPVIVQSIEPEPRQFTSPDCVQSIDPDCGHCGLPVWHPFAPDWWQSGLQEKQSLLPVLS
jgi:hypothetical protein